MPAFNKSVLIIASSCPLVNPRRMMFCDVLRAGTAGTGSALRRKIFRRYPEQMSGDRNFLHFIVEERGQIGRAHV